MFLGFTVFMSVSRLVIIEPDTFLATGAYAEQISSHGQMIQICKSIELFFYLFLLKCFLDDTIIVGSYAHIH